MAFWIVAVEASPWGFGWETLVAIGTLVLAVATGGLAWSTRNLASKTAEEVDHSKRQVAASLAQVDVAQQQAATAQAALDASQEQARLAQLTLNAQLRPVLVDMPQTRVVGQGKVEVILYPGRESQGTPGVLEAFVDGAGAMISVPMRNAGTGLAMIRGISLEVGEATPPALVTIQPANVPPGETARVNFAASPDHPAFEAMKRSLAPGGNFDVTVAYSDLAGQQMTLSHFSVYDSPDFGWVVRQVHLQEPGADEPFAGSAPTV